MFTNKIVKKEVKSLLKISIVLELALNIAARHSVFDRLAISLVLHYLVNLHHKNVRILFSIFSLYLEFLDGVFNDLHSGILLVDLDVAQKLIIFYVIVR